MDENNVFRYRDRVNPGKFKYAQHMRNNPTDAEAELWKHLRGKQLGGLRFRRQAVMLGYIADFYCPSLKLVIEVDGGYHEYNKDYDRLRDKRLSNHGFTVLRFTNEEVFGNLDNILSAIRAAAD